MKQKIAAPRGAVRLLGSRQVKLCPRDCWDRMEEPQYAIEIAEGFICKVPSLNTSGAGSDQRFLAPNVWRRSGNYNRVARAMRKQAGDLRVHG